MSLPGITIGFEDAAYSVEEGLAVEVCSHILKGTLELEVNVTLVLASSNGTAKGR